MLTTFILDYVLSYFSRILKTGHATIENALSHRENIMPEQYAYTNGSLVQLRVAIIRQQLNSWSLVSVLGAVHQTECAPMAGSLLLLCARFCSTFPSSVAARQWQQDHHTEDYLQSEVYI
jgi:hypothetical protein